MTLIEVASVQKNFMKTTEKGYRFTLSVSLIKILDSEHLD